MRASRLLRYAAFVAVVVANLVMFIGPFILKTEGDEGGTAWLIAAGVVCVGAAARAILKRRAGSEAQAWAGALRPAVLGAAIAGATLAFMLVVLPIVALANR